jgi:hypothetical protein
LTGLIKTALSPGAQTDHAVAAALLEACSKDKSLWLQYLEYTIDQYIIQVEEIEKLQ